MKPFVTILIPCYNEEKYVDALCSDILGQDYPGNQTEVIFIDGGSRDKTQEILNTYTGNHLHFKVLNNPQRYVSYALNLGIAQSKGEVIIRIDAHARYPSDYVSKLVEGLYSLNADNVGGSWLTVPSGKGIKAEAIALAMSSVFGVGNALYRLNVKKVRQVDTVPFGCYRREVFEKCGLFDEELIRNQDDEFNARLIKAGGRIFLIPDVRITYFARESIRKAMKMFFQYGYFKPLVNLKLGRPATIRQFIPPAYLLFLCLLIISSLWNWWMITIFGLALGIHLLFGFIFSIPPAAKTGRFGLIFLLPIVFLLVHLSYGYGYISGFLRFAIFRKTKSSAGTSR
jgi:glycosyltransferase involved in cell wall biosynthesis